MLLAKAECVSIRQVSHCMGTMAQCMHSLVAEAHLVWAGTPLKLVPVLSELR